MDLCHKTLDLARDFRVPIDQSKVNNALQRYLSILGAQRRVVRIRWNWSPNDPDMASARQIAREVIQKALLRFFSPPTDIHELRARAKLVLLDICDENEPHAAREALGSCSKYVSADSAVPYSPITLYSDRSSRVSFDARSACNIRANRLALAPHIAVDDLITCKDHNAERSTGAYLENVSEDTMRRLMAWCLWGCIWHSWDLSWISCIAFIAAQNGDKRVLSWSLPIWEAFCSGAWSLAWTSDTLYWVAHPRVAKDERGRLHGEDGPAIANDLEDLYFWHGVLVDKHIVLDPETITIEEVNAERNVEVRRIMIERMGTERYLRESGSRLMHMDALTIEGSAPRALVEDKYGDQWLIGTDGSTRRLYFMAVPRTASTCGEAHEMISGFNESKLIGEA